MKFILITPLLLQCVLGFTPEDSDELNIAVYLCLGSGTCPHAPGIPLSEWNVSKVTHMANLFADQYLFNDDISGWDVSQVTNMK